MYEDSFQGLSSAVCANVFEEMRCNDITEECTIICDFLGIASKLWIPLTDQITEIRHFCVPIFYLIVSGTSSRDESQIE
jgi:hypothetical protein